MAEMANSSRRPDLSASDVAEVSAVISHFNSWKKIRPSRIQTKMSSLRFAGRIAVLVGPPTNSSECNISSQADLNPDQLVLATDLRVMCMEDRFGSSLLKLESVKVQDDCFYGVRATFGFRHAPDAISLMKKRSSSCTMQYMMAGGKGPLIEKLVCSVIESALIYRSIDVVLPDSWVLNPIEVTDVEKVEYLHVAICDLIRIEICVPFLNIVRAGFPHQIEDLPTFNVYDCLGIKYDREQQVFGDYPNRLLSIVFALREFQGTMFKAVRARKCPLTDGVIDILGNVLDPAFIYHIDLTDSRLIASDIDRLKFFLADTNRPGLTLRTLIMSGNRIGDSSAADLIDVLRASHPQLQCLKIDNVSAGLETGVALATFLAQSTDLRRLDISGIILNKQATQEIATCFLQCTKLERISMSGGLNYAHILLDGLASTLRLQYDCLQSIVLKGTKLNSKSVKSIASILARTSTLRSLILGDTSLRGEHLTQLLIALQSNVHPFPFTLDLSSNNLQDHFWNSFRKTVGECETAGGLQNLERLFLCDNDISGKSLRKTCDAIERLPRLKVLSFDYTGNWNRWLSNASADGQKFGEMIHNCPALKVVSLAGRLGDKGVAAFFSELNKEESGVASIDVSWNGMAKKSFEAMNTYIRSRRCHLTELNIDHNSSSIDLLQSTVDAISENETLCNLMVSLDVADLRLTKGSCEQDIVRMKSELITRTVANRTRASTVYPQRSAQKPAAVTLQILLALGDDTDAHTTSVKHLPPKEHRNDRRSVFGRDLFSMQTSIPSGLSYPVPIVLQIMRAALEKMSAHLSEGIFRIAPAASEQATVRSFLNQGVYPRCKDVNAVADIYKQFFREMPSRIFDVISLADIQKVRTPEAAYSLIDRMPQAWRCSMLYTLDICAWVCHHTETNKMSPRSLAIIFSPNLTSGGGASSAPDVQMKWISFVKNLFQLALERAITLKYSDISRSESSERTGEGASPLYPLHHAASLAQQQANVLFPPPPPPKQQSEPRQPPEQKPEVPAVRPTQRHICIN